MRIVRHPNIVELKAFYYSNGERVCIKTLADSLSIAHCFTDQSTRDVERRSVPKFGAGVCA